MPELPEIETIVRDLGALIGGKLISAILVRRRDKNPILSGEFLEDKPDAFYDAILGQTVSFVQRRGKYVLMKLSNSNVLVWHLGMTGKFMVRPSGGRITDGSILEELDKHTHVVVELLDLSGDDAQDCELHFNDARTFGHLWWAKSLEEINIPGLCALGPDALSISAPEFEKIVVGKKPIKSLLLDQNKIAGIGNIYADEALFAAKINPTKPCHAVSPVERARLLLAIKTVLKQGIIHRGSSVQNYATPDGTVGQFQHYHRVYRKTGIMCSECNVAKIERIRIAGRSTHYCPVCQS